MAPLSLLLLVRLLASLLLLPQSLARNSVAPSAAVKARPSLPLQRLLLQVVTTLVLQLLAASLVAVAVAVLALLIPVRPTAL